MGACDINPQNSIEDLTATFSSSSFTNTINVKDPNKDSVSDAAYNKVLNLYTTTSSKIAQLEEYVKAGCFTTSKGTLAGIGSLQQEIAVLNKKIVEKTQDVDTSESRHNSIVKADKSVSDYQGISARLGFMRPIHEASVSILIGLGIFLSLISVYVVYTMFGPVSESGPGPNTFNTSTTYSGILGNFDKKAFLMGVGFIAVIVGILSYLGFYGRSQL